jgi:hypothetical protein
MKIKLLLKKPAQLPKSHEGLNSGFHGHKLAQFNFIMKFLLFLCEISI